MITVCDLTREQCPLFPGKVWQFHANFPDPAKATGTPEEIAAAFRHTRVLIRDYCREFVDSNL